MSFRFPGRALALLVLAAGCRSYSAKPLDPQDILDRMVAARYTAAPGETLTLEAATALLRANNPRLHEARAAYRTARAYADVKTPLPNPSLEVIPTYLDAGDVLGSDRWGVDASLGWSILLGGKRRLKDDLNKIHAQAAFVNAAGVEREEYIELRRDFVRLAAATRVRLARQALVASAEEARKLARQLVDAAQATELDVQEFELELYEAQARLLAAEEAETEARAALAARTGALPEAFAVTDFPPLPRDVPPVAKLHETLLRDHPDLARRRANYDVAEKELRLEIAGQYPNLDLGGIYERDGGDSKFGLGIGIEIPVFDRNQPGIARADARRDEVRARFEAQVRRGIAAIDLAVRRLALRRKRLALVDGKIRPGAERTLVLMRQTMEAGAGDALRFLTILRQQTRRGVAIIEAELAVYEAWADLEAACGAPLLRFPNEPGEQS